MGGQVVDATIVAAPKQRNTKEEKQAIKEGRIPEDWKDKPAKLRQKDGDARWTVNTPRPSRARMDCPWSTWRLRPSAARTISASTGVMV
jgi:hypothetical protein